MSVIRSFIIAFSMYSKLPMPRYEWSEKNARFVMCFFPVVGIVIGGLLYLLMMLAKRLALPVFPAALLAGVLPLIVTGGIHLDGFMDTSDALHSWRDRSKKLEILKDPHLGAFAVIALLVFLTLYLAAVYILVDACLHSTPGSVMSEPGLPSSADGILSDGGLSERSAGMHPIPYGFLPVWCLSFWLARIFSAFSVIRFRKAGETDEKTNTGTVFAFASVADRNAVTAVLCAELLLCALLMLYFSPFAGGLTLFSAAAVFGYYRYRSYREFGGISGDLAGWFLCICELSAAAACAVCCLLAAV